MALSLIDKLTNFLMPPEVVTPPSEEPVVEQNRKAAARLQLHKNAELKFFIASPGKYSDVLSCADRLKADEAVLVNLEAVDSDTQQSISDYLNGVCYIIGGDVQRVSEFMMLYVPAKAEISKQLSAYSIPTYVKFEESF